MNRNIAKLISLLAILALFSIWAFGQTETGQIAGTIRDASGAVVSGAKISVMGVNTGFTRDTVTNSDGIFTVPSLRPGPYQVTIEATGFQKITQQVTVAVGGVADVSTLLKVGGSATTVEVTGSGEAASVNTEDQTLSQVITTKQVMELPTLTRNPYDLVGTAGNVNEDSQSNRGAGFAINGQRSASTDILLDGGENVDLFSATVGQTVPLDSVQEFSVLTNNFTAEYGRASGGIVNVVTKSGTNAFHGTAYEFNRLSALSANTYNNNANDIAKGAFTRNQFGYSVGGPIVKNKLFFFNSTEWIRVRSTTTQNFTITDPSFLALPQISPATTSFFNAYGATRPLTVLSKVPWGIADGEIAPGGAVSGTCQFGIACAQPFGDVISYRYPGDAGGGLPQNTWMSVARVDFNWTDKTSIFGRYAVFHDNFFSGTINTSPYVGYDTGETDLNQNIAININHVFSPNLVSTTKLNYNRLTDHQPLGTAPLTPGLFSNAAVNALPGTAYQYVMPGYVETSTANALPFGGPQNLYQIYEDLSWTKGKHQFKFGGDYIQTRDNRVFGAYENAVQILGSNLFDGVSNLVNGNTYQYEAAIYPQGNYPCSKTETGHYNVTPSCLFNLPATSPSFKRNYIYNDWALYGQDSWKISPRLTLSLGLRWEYYGVQHDSNSNLDSNFYLGSGSSFQDQIRNGAVSLTKKSSVGGFWNPVYKNFAPRVGFAWDVFGDGTTSLRGGYGISYERNFGNVTYNTIQNPPNYAVVSVFGEGIDVPSQPVYTANLGPLAGSAGSTCGTSGIVPAGKSCIPNVTLRAPNQNIKTAYSGAWDMSVDRQVARNTVFSLEYAGAHGVHLYDIGNINVPYYGSTYLGDTHLSNRLNYQYGSINYRGSEGYSHYNGVTAKLSSSNLWNKGLMLNVNYTWSHSTDNLSSTFSDGYWGNYWLGYTDYFNPSLDYGNSDYNVAQRFVVSAVWDLPWMKNSSNAFARAALGGWSMSPIFKVRSGSPYTIFDCSQGVTICPRWSPAGALTQSQGGVNASSNAGPNVFNYMPLPVSGTAVAGTADSLQVPNQSIFCNSVVGGNPFTCSGLRLPDRNAFYGPGYWNIDWNFYKNFKLTERFTMQFRSEFYNIFNHHNQYISTLNLDVSAISGASPYIQSEKGGIFGAAGAPTDERRNIQFALKLIF